MTSALERRHLFAQSAHWLAAWLAGWLGSAIAAQLAVRRNGVPFVRTTRRLGETVEYDIAFAYACRTKKNPLCGAQRSLIISPNGVSDD